MTSGGMGGMGGAAELPAPQRMLRFLVTGSSGFIVDAAVMTLLINAGPLDPAWARTISFPVALAVTWVLNRVWAFGDRERPRLGREFAGYVLIQLASFAANYMMFLLLVTGWLSIQLVPVLALAVASAVAAVLTYVLLNCGLYRRPVA